MEKFVFWLVFVESTTFQVAASVMSPPGTAVALKYTGDPLIDTDWLPGDTVIEVTPVKTTVTVVVPLHAEHPPEDAVIVADPVWTPVAMPEVCPTDTVVASLVDHTTPDCSVFWLPSL
jgi:hypothetical protein